MAKKNIEIVKSKQPKLAPAMTPEARQNQLIALATNLAEERLRNGTASSAEIVHFLKLGSTKNKLEEEIMQEEKKLMIAKTEAIQSGKDIEKLYSEAIDAMMLYTGSIGNDDGE